ncbi:hypothetical protein HHK36_030482 [Tetracentron sinense]|uniref:NAC domain-containing protein n=1 Tax=Tetracentron sinense TaxID=13715 RepID=A0A834YCX3_TETSI|nr:hypothetical protein HHK36_030482 [Tetracentron sinense]
MARGYLLPGFRFHPTDVELVMFYLKRKVMGKPIRVNAISELDLYKFAPWDLPEKSCLESRDLEWYFFCPRDRKYSSGSRINRATKIGYWKTTGKDRLVLYNSRTVGMKKTLVFHIGRAPHGDRTDWVMHEYRFEDKDLVDTTILQDAYVLCKIFQKSGPGPKNGEQYGALFKEEDWNDNVVNNSVECPLANPDTPPLVLADDQNVSMVNTTVVPESMWLPPLEPIPCQTVSSNPGKEHLSLSEDGEIVSLLEMFRDEDTLLSDDNDKNLNPDSPNLDQSNVDAASCSDGNEIYIGLEDLSTQTELNIIDRFQFSNNLVAEYVLDQTLLGNDVAYLELNDLECPLEGPVEANRSVPIPNDDLSAQYYDFNNLEGVCNSVLSADNGICENENRGDEASIYNPAFAPGEISEDNGKNDAFQALARALLPRFMLKEAAGAPAGEKEGASYSRLQSLLDSIPAHPASAAEHPTPYGGSSIHVEAKVAVRDGRNPQRRELGRRVSSEFKFVFFLGVVSGLMWVFLFAMCARLGRYVWKLFLP